jgi:hypothetical protein
LLKITATTLVATAFAYGAETATMAGGRSLGWATRSLWSRPISAGDLVYRQHIGVTHADASLPRDFTPAVNSAAVPENTMVRSRAADIDVLLVRQLRERGGRIGRHYSRAATPLRKHQAPVLKPKVMSWKHPGRG